MQIYEVFNTDIDIIKRLDFNYWNPRQKLATSDRMNVKKLVDWIGRGNLSTSAFYPAITPFYQTKNDIGDLIPFIRVNDTRKLLLEYDETVFLNRELLDDLSSNIKRVYPRDVVITKGGEYIGEAALVPDYYEEYTICRDLLVVRTKDSEISGEYITSYFHSKLGKSDLIRTRSVQGQPHLTVDKVNDLDIPYLGIEFEKEIIEYWQTFYTLIAESDEHLINAKRILNEYLKNMLDVKEKFTTYIKELTSKDIIKRVDFDYYQKRWSKLVDYLKTQEIEFDAVSFQKDSIDVSDTQKIYKYITLSDIDDRSGIIKSYNDLPVYDLPDRAKRGVKYRDVLVSSLKGSKGKVALVEDEYDNMVASTGFYVVRSNTLEPEVLYTIFRSEFYNLFIEQMASGAIMSSIIEKYFKQLKLPRINVEIQGEISYEIKNYLSKRKDAFDCIEMAATKFDDVLIEV